MTELEALGAVWAVKHFRPYLYGHSCHLYTDHDALKSLLNTPHSTSLREISKMGIGTAGGGHTHPLLPRQENANADALSRCPLSLKTSQNDQSNVFGIVSAISVPQFQAKTGRPT